MRARSQRLVGNEPLPIADEIDAPNKIDAFKQSCWANMPVELLRDVLSRIEASESLWPLRKTVVACAGVCRSWRKITMDLVKSPEVSGKLTFPLSLKQPGPRSFPFKCFIQRNGANQTYHLYLCVTGALTNPGKFLLAARRSKHPMYTEFIICLEVGRVSRRSASFLGKLRSNFAGTQFTVHEAVHPPSAAVVSRSISFPFRSMYEYYLVAHVSYGVNELGPRGPRRMLCTIDRNATSAADVPVHVSKVVLKNKSPRWHEQLRCWCLNFNGRVTMPSVKNFQLVVSPSQGNDNGPNRLIMGQSEHDVVLQFGKVAKDLFTMDFRIHIQPQDILSISISS